VFSFHYFDLSSYHGARPISSFKIQFSNHAVNKYLRLDHAVKCLVHTPNRNITLANVSRLFVAVQIAAVIMHLLSSLLLCVSVQLACVLSLRYEFNATHPIYLVTTDLGPGNFERVSSLRARIYPHHVRERDRVSFPRSGLTERRFNVMREGNDERGHVLASQFSGPPEWNNLVPQTPRVNRNYQVRYITTDWFGAEYRVREFLIGGSLRYVDWDVDMWVTRIDLTSFA